MINGYTIRNVNGEDVMYLFFDFNYEFSSFDFMAKREKVHDVVKNFIRDHNIFFKGATILLVSGGVLFGSINLNTPSFSQVSMNNNVSIEEHVNSSHDDIVNGDVVNDKRIVDEKSLDDSSLNKVDVVSDKAYEQNVVNDNSNEFKSDSSSNNIANDSAIVDSVPSNEAQQNSLTEQEVVQEVVDNNIYVNVRRSDGSVSRLELEEYVIGVVGAEMPALFNSEALKAQAVIARTYALKANSNGRTLSDNESTQSYKDNGQLASMWGGNYSSYYNRIRDAVMSTSGMYLTYNGQYIEAVYHSTSNGRTEDSSNVWGNYYPYLVSVDSLYDNSNSSFSISKTFSYDELSSKLGIIVNDSSVFNILGYTSGGRVSVVSVGGVFFSGINFRSKLGLRSADFDISETDGGFIITTRGYGHGVGMSQYGANGMAKAGSSYRDILLHYYPGVSIDRL